MKFDPITFLEIKDVPKDKEGRLRTAVYYDMVRYLLERFIDELADSDKLVVERRARKMKQPEEVLKLIADYLPDFEERKVEWLKEYKRTVDLGKFKEVYG